MSIKTPLLIAFTCGLLIAASRSLAQEPKAVPGLTAERPAEGPFVKTDQGYMIPYAARLPGSDVTFQMIPIPGGRVRMGSPANEEGRQENEGPPFEVELPPFWIGKYEVSWAEYKPFMGLYSIFKEFESRGLRKITEENKLDAITAPTELYEPSFTFEKGEDPRLPAVTMTQYAARQYTKWLSLTSGQFYRLPTEAEWEYACRAGTTTAYSFGDDPAQLDEYAWHEDNADDTSHFVGLKKPNPWGLYDMHGNVAEWVIDELLDDGYAKFKGARVSRDEALVWPTKPYPRVVRGGHWGAPAEECRSASRLGSHDEEWKDADPNQPLSPWWFTSDPARGVGFRVVRQLKSPSRAQQERFWKADADDIILDVQIRLDEGRGALGLVDPALPQAAKQLDQ